MALWVEFGFPWICSINFFGSWWDVDGTTYDSSDLDLIELGFRWPND